MELGHPLFMNNLEISFISFIVCPIPHLNDWNNLQGKKKCSIVIQKLSLRKDKYIGWRKTWKY